MCTLHVTYHFMLHHYITVYYSLLLTNTCEALFGGGAYVHTYHTVANVCFILFSKSSQVQEQQI